MDNFFKTHFSLISLAKVGITILLGFIIISILKKMIRIYFKKKKISHQNQIIYNKIINFIGISIVLITTINQLGFSSLFTTVLGTAGIAGLAFSFASKTSLENIISGILLLSDKSFKIDDTINVNGIEGTVESIDSLSVKIRAYDNSIVRVPNVKILNSEVANIYPSSTKRRDFYFMISNKSNLDNIENLLMEIAAKNDFAIEPSNTLVYFSSFSELGIKVKYGVWFKKGNITQITNTITRDIIETFKKEQIDIPTFFLSNKEIEQL